MPFSARTDVVGRCCRIHTGGEIDLAVADDFAAAGMAGLAVPDVDAVVIDLAGVTFMDSTGLSALVQIRNEALRLDKHLDLDNVPQQVRQILTITGLADAFGLVDLEVDGVDLS